MTTNTPDTMDCLCLDAWGGDLARTTAAVPPVGLRDVLVSVEATSVGLTFAKATDGGLGDDGANLPRIPGHEPVGEVVEVGDEVTDVEPGAFVGAYFYLVCDHCGACHAGPQSRCENHAGLVGVDIDGGFAEYARLPAGRAMTLPDAIVTVAATVVPDAVATPYHVANRRAQIAPGDDVLVPGAGGGVGIHMEQVARHFGATVTAVTSLRRNSTAVWNSGPPRRSTPATGRSRLTARTDGRTTRSSTSPGLCRSSRRRYGDWRRAGGSST